VAIFRHPQGAVAPDPIIYLEGGPGGSSLEMIRYSFDSITAPLFAAGRDLIIFDQRGVGNSIPALDCPEVVSQSLDLLDFEIDGKSLSDKDIYNLNLTTTLACAKRLHQDVDLSAYHTAANAADVNDLRIALGYDQVNLWSISYGTRLALSVMRDYPQGIRSVVLDSVYPPDVDLFQETPANMAGAFRVLFDQCAADQDCNQAYPHLQEQFYQTAQALDSSPVSQTITNPLTGETYTALLDGDTFIALIFRLLYDSSVIPLLPKIIADANQGDLELIAQIRSLILMNLEAVSRGMYYTVLCHDEYPFSNFETHQAVLDNYPQLVGLFENAATGKFGYQLCEGWDAGQAAEIDNQPVSSAIPALVMAGEFDPIAPPAWSRHAAETLENAYYFEYPAVGHGASVVAGCPQEMMIAFFNDPSQMPAGTCIADMAIEFATPTDPSVVNLVPLTVDQFGIRALVPQGWYQAKPEYFLSPDTTVELVVAEVQDETQEDFLVKWGASEPFMELENNNLNWSLREVARPDDDIAGYLATAPSENGFYLVLLISTPDKQAALYEYIFSPIVTSFEVDPTLLPADSPGNPAPHEDRIGDDPAANDLALQPYSSEAFGIKGLVPAGWLEAAPGIVARQAAPADQTVLIQKSYPGMTLAQLNQVLLPQLGITTLPSSLEQYQSGEFTWNLYQVEVPVPEVGTIIVDIAQFESGGTAYLVLLQTQAEDYQSLHAQVFIPVLQALELLG